jgi:HTH-type transcriptional regulator/antitoxin HigA
MLKRYNMLKPIKIKKDYEDALAGAHRLMQKDLKPGSRLSDELEILSVLIEGYEEKRYPIAPPILSKQLKSNWNSSE